MNVNVGMVYVSKAAKTYLSNIPSHLKTSEFPLTNFDSRMLEGFQKDLPVFEGVKMKDIAFITRDLKTVNLFRGCKLGCSHCKTNALAPMANKETVLYEDIKRLGLGFKTLSERLGFDVLNGNKSLNVVEDSNPLDMPVKGVKRNHGIAEVVEFLYDTMNIPTVLQTSCWPPKRNPNYMYTYNSTKSLVTLAKNKPEALKEVQVSVNPFVDVANYPQRAAETIYGFLDLFKNGKAKVVYQHTKKPNKGFDAEAAQKIYEKIYSILQEMCGSKLDSIPLLKPERVTKITNSTWIEQAGRAKQFFTEEENDILHNKLLNEKLHWNGLSQYDKTQKMLNFSKKHIDIDGCVRCSIPTRIECNEHPIELNIPTNIQLNYVKREKPNKIFSEIEI